MTVKARKKHDIIKVGGTTKYCHLNEPNKTYKKEYGEYQCEVILTPELAEQVKKQLRPVYEQELKDRQDQEGKEVKKADIPSVEKDGQIIIKTKLKGGVMTKAGKEYLFSVAMYDAAGKPLPKDVQVWGGSKVNVAFRPNFWYTASLGFGVSFEIAAVQVIELANGGVSEQSAESFGFTAEEGYVANGGETLDSAFDAEETEETLTANF
jgi:hypothetical protein